MIRLLPGNSTRKPRNDPVRLAVAERAKQLGGVQVSEHLWSAEPGITLEPGVYLIEVKAIDEWCEYEGRRLLHVK